MRQPQDLRRRNRRDIALYLLEEGPLTRPDLAEKTGLSKVTVNAIVQELLEGAIIQLGAVRNGAAGRHAQTVQLGKIGDVAALDVQAEQMQLQIVDLCGSVTCQKTVLYEPHRVMQALSAQLAHLQKFGKLHFIVVGVPAPVDPSGQVSEPNALTDLDREMLHAALAATGVPYRFENDANLVALAAAGQWPELSHLAALVERPSGTGLGLILNGELYRGVRGRAGELGRSLWPVNSEMHRLECLPSSERLRATALLLASLVQTLDLQHVVLGLPQMQAEALAAHLRPLLPDGLSPSLATDVDALALTGASSLALKLGREAFLSRLEKLSGSVSDVA